MSAKVLGICPDGSTLSVHPFESIFSSFKDVSTEGFDGIDALLLQGGEDIDSNLYGEKAHPYNGSRGYRSKRDEFERKAVLYCRAKNIPIIGTCRGAQMLCAMAGGTLIQHVTGHGLSHTVYTQQGEVFPVTSVHHQMMYPYGIPHELLAWSNIPQSSVYHGATDNQFKTLMENKPEPEIVYFPQLKGLAIQGHPEYANAGKQFVEFCIREINERLFK